MLDPRVLRFDEPVTEALPPPAPRPRLQDRLNALEDVALALSLGEFHYLAGDDSRKRLNYALAQKGISVPGADRYAAGVRHGVGNFFDRVNEVFRGFDVAVSQPLFHPIGDALNAIDRNVTQPVVHPIGQALAAIDRTVTQPIAHAIGQNVLVPLDQVVLRPVYQPVARNVAAGVRVLDKYVPGWASLIDALTPLLPFAPALSAALAAIAGVTPAVLGAVVESASGVVAAITPSGTPSLISQIFPTVTGRVENSLVSAVDSVASAGQVAAHTIAPVQATLGKALATYETTEGTLLAKLQAVGEEVAKGAALVVSVAGFVTGPASFALGLAPGLAGTAASGTSAGLLALEEGANAAVLQLVSAVTSVVTNAIDLAHAQDAARRLKTAAAKQHAVIVAQTSAVDSEIAALEAELRALEGQLVGAAGGLSTPAKGFLLVLSALAAGEVLS